MILEAHTSAQLQTLDVGIYFTCITHYKAAMECWVLRNPGKESCGDLRFSGADRTNIHQDFAIFKIVTS